MSDETTNLPRVADHSTGSGEADRNTAGRSAGCCHSLSARAWRTASSLDGCLRERPWRSLGLVAATGFLIGLLLGRR